MSSVVSIDGKIVAPEEAKISVFDRGFLYGDSVYEVLRTYRGECFEVDAHLARLEGSARRIGLSPSWDRSRLMQLIAEALTASGHELEQVESYVRLMVTRGSGEIGLDPELALDPCTLVIVRALVQPPREAYTQGVKVAILDRGPQEGDRLAPRPSGHGAAVDRNWGAHVGHRVDPRAKTGNYLPNVLAMAEAKRRGAFEAMRVSPSGELTEGSSSNLFVVNTRDELLTPPLEAGLLEGVTRHCVLEAGRGAGLVVREQALTPEALEQAQEAFLTSSIREIVPITWVEEAPVGEGVVGPVTRRVQAAFRLQSGRPFGDPPF